MNYAHALSKIDMECHPVARDKFRAFFTEVSRTPGLSFVRPFCILRTPAAQAEALKAGNSKVGPWRSVHQYGCAIDFVPFMGGKWEWDWDGWDRLHRLGERFGVHAPISWDKPHFVPIGWRTDLRAWLLTSSFT